MQNKKILILQGIHIELSNNNIIPSILCIIDSNNNLNLQYKTNSYAIIQQNAILWKQSLQIDYKAQKILKFLLINPTIKQQTQMIHGIINIKPELFFKENQATLLKNGKQCGVLKFVAKVVNKDPNQKYNNQNIESDKDNRVNDDAVNSDKVTNIPAEIVGKINLYGASFIANHNTVHFFNKKHRGFELQLKYENKVYLGKNICPSKAIYTIEWSYINPKIYIKQNREQNLIFKICYENQKVVEGELKIAKLQKDKRYLVHEIIMEDKKGNHIGILQLDIRYINRQELLQLINSSNLQCKAIKHNTESLKSRSFAQSLQEDSQKDIKSARVIPDKNTLVDLDRQSHQSLKTKKYILQYSGKNSSQKPQGIKQIENQTELGLEGAVSLMIIVIITGSQNQLLMMLLKERQAQIEKVTFMPKGTTNYQVFGKGVDYRKFQRQLRVSKRVIRSIIWDSLR